MKNTMTIVGLIIFVIGTILVVTNIGDIMMNPQKLVGTVLFVGMVYRYVKTEYCMKEAE